MKVLSSRPKLDGGGDLSRHRWYRGILFQMQIAAVELRGVDQPIPIRNGYSGFTVGNDPIRGVALAERSDRWVAAEHTKRSCPLIRGEN